MRLCNGVSRGSGGSGSSVGRRGVRDLFPV
jgi:hypothetical protein